MFGLYIQITLQSIGLLCSNLQFKNRDGIETDTPAKARLHRR